MFDINTNSDNVLQIFVRRNSLRMVHMRNGEAIEIWERTFRKHSSMIAFISLCIKRFNAMS